MLPQLVDNIRILLIILGRSQSAEPGRGSPKCIFGTYNLGENKQADIGIKKKIKLLEEKVPDITLIKLPRPSKS